MYNFKRVLVGLDFSLMDQQVLEYTKFICEKIKPSKIYFTHVHKDLAIPPEVIKEFPQFREPMDEKLEKDMRKRVDLYFKGAEQYDIDYEVIEGAASKELLHRVEVKNIDLLIMGRKNELPGNGVIPRQIARYSKSSVLLVPESPKQELKSILVPIDFSDYSKLAMEEAIMIASEKENQDIKVTALNIYDLPSFGGGISYSETKLEPLIRSNSVDAYNTFMNEIETKDVQITPSFQMNSRYAGAALINGIAHRMNADMIVVGAQGKTGLKRIFIGSFTEKLIEHNEDLPLLVVKHKIDREA